MTVKARSDYPRKPLIEIKNLAFRYGQDEEEPLVLKDIGLEIGSGEFVAVIGPNGSGKSTLAKHLNALLVPTRGAVLVDGMDTRLKEYTWSIRQRVGMVFQNPDNQIVATVVEEDVAFGPENLGIKAEEIRRRVDLALGEVRMGDYAKNAPHALSGGQKQRVAIAGVLAMKPRCIVLDEPTAMLDPVGRFEVLETVRRLCDEEGITIVYVTHFMEEASLADRVVVLSEGRIILEGPPRKVFKEVDILKRIGLDVPEMTDLAIRLRRRNVDVPADTLTVDEMTAALRRVCEERGV